MDIREEALDAFDAYKHLTEGQKPNPELHKKFLADPKIHNKNGSRMGYGAWLRDKGLADKGFVKSGAPTKQTKEAKKSAHMKHHAEYMADKGAEVPGKPGWRISYAAWLRDKKGK